jgi:hypothetical protein
MYRNHPRAVQWVLCYPVGAGTEAKHRKGRNGFRQGGTVGHIRNGNGVYVRLQKRLDRFPIGAPPASALYEILKRLYTEEEAEIAARMPIRFTDLAGIARRTKKSEDVLRPIL